MKRLAKRAGVLVILCFAVYGAYEASRQFLDGLSGEEQDANGGDTGDVGVNVEYDPITDENHSFAMVNSTNMMFWWQCENGKLVSRASLLDDDAPPEALRLIYRFDGEKPDTIQLPAEQEPDYSNSKDHVDSIVAKSVNSRKATLPPSVFERLKDAKELVFRAIGPRNYQLDATLKIANGEQVVRLLDDCKPRVR